MNIFHNIPVQHHTLFVHPCRLVIVIDLLKLHSGGASNDSDVEEKSLPMPNNKIVLWDREM